MKTVFVLGVLGIASIAAVSSIMPGYNRHFPRKVQPAPAPPDTGGQPAPSIAAMAVGATATPAVNTAVATTTSKPAAKTRATPPTTPKPLPPSPNTSVPPAPNAPITPNVPRAFFGMHIHNNSGAVPWPSVAIGSVRLHDTRTTWARLEPEDNKWEFARLDMLVNQATQHGAEILYTLGQTPTWAAARPNDPSMYGPDTTGSEPKDMELWRDYIATLAKRYKGKIKYYEVWNEPNYNPFYTGNTKVMAEMTRIAKETLTEIDPGARLVSPGVTMTDNVMEWLDAYFSHGGGKYIDIIGYHFYIDRPEDIVAETARLKSLLKKYGLNNKPIWNTESGWCIQNKPGTPQVELNGICPNAHDVLDPDKASAYIARSLLLAHVSGISRFFWYDWDGENMGLVENDYRTLKKPALAFATTQSWLSRGFLKGCSETGGYWRCTLATTNGLEYVVWHPTHTSASLPIDWDANTVTTLYNTTQNTPLEGPPLTKHMPVLLAK